MFADVGRLAALSHLLPTPDLQGLGGLGSGPSEDLKSEGRLQAYTSKRVQSTDIVECRVSILGSAAMI